MSTMYGELLRLAYLQQETAAEASETDEALVQRLQKRRARCLGRSKAIRSQGRAGTLVGEVSGDVVASGTAAVINYDLALIMACERWHVDHRLLRHADDSERARVEALLREAGIDVAGDDAAETT